MRAERALVVPEGMLSQRSRMAQVLEKDAVSTLRNVPCSDIRKVKGLGGKVARVSAIPMF